jgi:hypothetical protein
MRTEVRQILGALTSGLNSKVRESIARRFEAMRRELAYLSDKEDKNLAFIRLANWTEGKLSVLFLLNCFYQHVLGPLQSSTRGGTANIGTKIPIRYGSALYDEARSKSVNSAVSDFHNLVAELGFDRRWLTKNTAGDLIYYIARHEREMRSLFDGN